MPLTPELEEKLTRVPNDEQRELLRGVLTSAPPTRDEPNREFLSQIYEADTREAIATLHLITASGDDAALRDRATQFSAQVARMYNDFAPSLDALAQAAQARPEVFSDVGSNVLRRAPSRFLTLLSWFCTIDPYGEAHALADPLALERLRRFPTAEEQAFQTHTYNAFTLLNLLADDFSAVYVHTLEGASAHRYAENEKGAQRYAESKGRVYKPTIVAADDQLFRDTLPDYDGFVKKFWDRLIEVGTAARQFIDSCYPDVTEPPARVASL